MCSSDLVRGVFTVPETLALPPELHVGPIRPGARHNAYVRFSAGSWARVKKQQPDVRAVAFKLVGVPGKKVLTGEEAPGTQDFLLNHGPTVPVRTPDEFVALAEAVSRSQAQALFRLIGSIGFGRAFSVLKGTIAGLNLPFSSYGSATFHSIAPSRLGPTACKWSLTGAGDAAGKGTLHEDLVARLAGGLRYTLRVRLYQDPTRTPIEDATRDWEGDWIEVGSLEIPATDVTTPEARALADEIERMSFDPWHAVEELRPLGAISRARKVAYYEASVKHRDVAPEPQA